MMNNVNYKRLVNPIYSDEKIYKKTFYGVDINFLLDILNEFDSNGFTSVEIDERTEYDKDNNGIRFISFVANYLKQESTEKYNKRIAKEEAAEQHRLDVIKIDKLRKQKTIDEKIQLEKDHLEKLAAKFGAKIIYENN